MGLGGCMDIAALSMAMHQSQIKQAISISVLKMAMDSETQNMQKMLEMAVTPHIGGNVDIRI